VTGSLTTSGSLTATGTITATTLVVQTVTSSISSITGSTNFGSLSTNTHTFTGSILTSGSIGIGTNSPVTLLNLSSPNPVITLTRSDNGTTGAGAVNFTATSTVKWQIGTNQAIGNGLEFNAGDQTNNKMYLNTSGNLGIGTSSPSAVLSLEKAKAGSGVENLDMLSMRLTGTTALGDSLNIGFFNGTNVNIANIKAILGGDNVAYGTLGFYTRNYYTDTVIESLRITQRGYTKITNNASYVNTAGTYHEIVNSAADNIVWMRSSHATSPYGPYIQFSAASPNNTSQYFLGCADSTTTRLEIRANGGIANYSGNNVNLSDIRTKKEISPLESYWNKFKAIEIVRFKYKDQTHDDFNIGVIAQQVEEVAPEFIDVDGFGNTPEDGVPLKSVYEADLHHATIKVLQEAMAKIETLETEIEELKARI